MTHAYAHAHFSNKRVIRELRIVSCPGGGVWVAVTREFERDNCVISEILQSDWTIPNRAGVPRKSTKVPRPSFRVWAGRSGHETSLVRYLTSDFLVVLSQHVNVIRSDNHMILYQFASLYPVCRSTHAHAVGTTLCHMIVANPAI